MLTAGFYLKSPVRYTKNKLPIIQFVYHLLVTLSGLLVHEITDIFGVDFWAFPLSVGAGCQYVGLQYTYDFSFGSNYNRP